MTIFIEKLNTVYLKTQNLDKIHCLQNQVVGDMQKKAFEMALSMSRVCSS